MQFKDTWQVRLTESIMEAVTRKLPEIDKHNYNRTFEAVLDTLNAHTGVVPGLGTEAEPDWAKKVRKMRASK